MPALWGDGYVIEFRPNNRGGARVRFTWLNGHHRWRWVREGQWTFDISPAYFRELTAKVDEAIVRFRPDPGPMRPDEEERIVCTDGPGFLTERVRETQVISLSGSCPYSWDDEHPNRMIESAVLNFICPRFRHEFNPRDGLGAACVRRDRRIRSARR